MSIKLQKYSGNKIKRKYSGNSCISDDARLSICSGVFGRDFENYSIDIEAAPMNSPEKKGQIFYKEIDTNICLVRYNELKYDAENTILASHQCKKCQAYLNKYSSLNKSEENGKYEWICEFCSEINKDLAINEKDIPTKDCVEKCLQPPKENEKKINDGDIDDSSLIFCFDISGSMSQSYDVGSELKEKFYKIREKNIKKKKKFNLSIDCFDFDNYSSNNENTNYVSRLDLVKISIENNISSLLKNSPDVKVGIVSFGNEIEVKGDCLSNTMLIKEKDMNNEEKIKSLGEENTNLIKSPIKQSSSKILQSLYSTEEKGSTALGPAILLSLSLMKNAKMGSRIFLCTDGESNLGIGNIFQDRDKSKIFYSKIGETARQKGIVINLITFEDSESEIEVLMNMVNNSGGEIIRVNPHAILNGFNDLLENEVIASEVEVKMILNKCMTFRDKEEKDMINDGSAITQKIGNVLKETENYFELKFKKALILADMKDINFDDLKNLTFQCEIIYRKKNGGKYARIISKNLKISDNKEEVEKQADFDIISTMEVQKSAKLASEGLFREAQAQAHIARKFLGQKIQFSDKNEEAFLMFNNNMNSFNSNLEKLNDEKKKSEKDNTQINPFKKNDELNQQIFSLSRTSKYKQKSKFERSKK